MSKENGMWKKALDRGWKPDGSETSLALERKFYGAPVLPDLRLYLAERFFALKLGVKDLSLINSKLRMPEESVIVCAADVQEEKLDWLDPWRIAFGKITLLTGNPKVGKSYFTADLTARTTKGLAMPPSTEMNPCRDPANVLMCNAEDDPADTIRPRLRVHGADLKRVLLWGYMPDKRNGRRPISFPGDLARLEKNILEKECRLCIIDPLAAFLGYDVDSHRDSDIRRILFQIQLIAQRTRCAIVVVAHLNKMSSEKNAMYRVGGSIGLVGAARSVLLIGKPPNDPSQSVLCSLGSNNGPTPPALAFRLVPEGDSVKVNWLGEVDIAPEQLLEPPGKRGEAMDQAKEFLKTQLANGPKLVNLVEDAREKNGISRSTRTRAYKEMGIISTKENVKNGRWLWRLPAEASNEKHPEPPTTI